MKFSLKYLLVYCWVLTNFVALIAIASTYYIAWHALRKGDSITPEKIQSLANLMSKEQLSKMFVEQDYALRGAQNAIYTMLRFWLDITLLNIAITIGYCYRLRQKAGSSP